MRPGRPSRSYLVPENSATTGGESYREFRIYFNTAPYGVGTDETLNKYDSIWDINEDTRMTITYKIPYDTIVVDADGKELNTTVGELLSQGNTLTNNVYYRRSGVVLYNSATLEKKPKTGSIDKTARYLGNGVVEYRVGFDNADEKGNRFIKLNTDREVAPGSKISPETYFEDMFDKRMEYVADSLRLEVYWEGQESDGAYAVYKYNGNNGNPLTEKNTLNVNVQDFVLESYDGLWFNAGDGISKVFAAHWKIYFVYQLQLNDEDRNDWKPDQDIKNTACLRYGDNAPTDDASVDIPYDMLQKNFEAVPGQDGVLQYTIQVNPSAIDLVQVDTGEDTFVNLDSYKLVDQMSSNLQLVTTTDGGYDITVEYCGESGAWQPLTRSSSTTGINKASHNYFMGVEEDNAVSFILPDELYIRITYKVIVNGKVNAQEIAENTATLYADHTETDEKTTIVEIGDSSASGSSDPTINLQKVDALQHPDILRRRNQYQFRRLFLSDPGIRRQKYGDHDIF